MVALSNFKILRPKREGSQQELLEWVAKAHAKAGTDVREKLLSLGLGEGKVQKRGSSLEDYFKEDWAEMDVYTLEKHPAGAGLGDRMKHYDRIASEVFEDFFAREELPPSPNLIHVTCTGYVAPSPAQKLVSKRQWSMEVLHAYHMGCYGSIPAIKMGIGNLAQTGGSEIVHTEICGLHLNPSIHAMDQLVIESLFADGFIRYSVREEGEGFKVLGILEELIPNTLPEMTWDVGERCFDMHISKAVPVHIARNLDGYLRRLSKKAGIEFTRLQNARFAIHPGGPKIIDQIARVLGLEEDQVFHSKQVLQNFGNMSSATLPHVWNALLEDEKVAKGELVVSVAFGPGLTVAGALFETQ